ncbi:hsp70 nucleotide exchange factor fes1 [Malassezia cuniculi]|uniref:Hsp70 nucleotide exchange factor fes1 n=1 Tax=Malassezia cuniculi TaxID=948313 RepID=A0AAF0J5G6_9BASI|nr:hsp70 nucleotide exchange factor fes1 [Malassezia cuniculi]
MAGNRNADELLRWGLANSNRGDGAPSIAQISEDIAAGRRPDLADPALYEAIMGKSEAQMMIEELTVAADTSRSIDDRAVALDNFEMLIEQIDNANNMESLGMWPVVISFCGSEHDPQIQSAGAWIIGTAIQNNDKAQVVALRHGVLRALLPLLGSSSAEVRSRGIYAISSLLRHFPRAVTEFSEANGWESLRKTVADPAPAVRRKTAFLLGQLITQDTSEPGRAPAEHSPSTAMVAADGKPDQDGSLIPSAPLEEGPATLKLGSEHPDVSAAILNNGIAATMLGTVLAPATLQAAVAQPGLAHADAEVAQASFNACPDAYNDLDYAEKAVTTLSALAAKVGTAYPLPRVLYAALVHDLQGQPSDSAAGATRAAELGLDKETLQPLAQFAN